MAREALMTVLPFDRDVPQMVRGDRATIGNACFFLAGAANSGATSVASGSGSGSIAFMAAAEAVLAMFRHKSIEEGCEKPGAKKTKSSAGRKAAVKKKAKR
jgi:hypothetical protein